MNVNNDNYEKVFSINSNEYYKHVYLLCVCKHIRD